MAVTDEQIILKYLELRAQVERMENELKLRLMPIKKDMGVIEEVMGFKLNSLITPKNTKPKIKTDAGTAYKKNIFSASIKDKPTFLKYAFAHDMSLLDIRVNSTGVEDHINKRLESNPAANPLIPGIETSRFDKVVFRKA
jgi:hypothetical protein